MDPVPVSAAVASASAAAGHTFGECMKHERPMEINENEVLYISVGNIHGA
jgi:hypothetical protein